MYVLELAQIRIIFTEIAQFFSHFFCRLLPKQPTDLSAALKAADKPIL
jgi:hypothetical protein